MTLGGGAYVLRASASVGIARFESFALSAQLHPAPQSGAEGISFDARPLRSNSCTASHERARLSAAATPLTTARRRGRVARGRPARR